jgi:ATP-dependent Clp protease ATP-binding subunit ClpX
MLDVMYEVPSQVGIKECLVNEETIVKKERPILVYEKQAESA